jgi:hypothetical protein
VATVTLTFVEAHPTFPCVAFPNGIVEEFPFEAISALDWSPPPWEPVVGEPARHHGLTYVVRGIYNDFAWAEDVDGDMYSILLADLSPPKGGA